MSCLSTRVCLNKTPCENVLADITLPISPSPRKWREATAHHQKYFGAFFSAESQQKELNYSVRRANTCVLLVQNPSSVLSHACLAERLFTCVCFSEMFLHVSAPAKHHLTQLAFQRTLTFPFQLWPHVQSSSTPHGCILLTDESDTHG